MVIIGIDPHPKSHTAAALDKTGKVIGHVQIDNDADGIAALFAWLAKLEVKVCGVEGANNHFARELSLSLLKAGYKVVNVSPNLTSQYRRKRGAKKSDEVDAENVARVVMANAELVVFDGSSLLHELKQLTRTRETLANQHTALELSQRSLGQATAKAALQDVMAIIKQKLKALEKAMRAIIKQLMPELLNLQGIATVHAATLLAEAGDVRHFRSQHAFAMFAGCAPLERSSGGQQRKQVNPGGNRRLNRSFHMIAQVRLRLDQSTQAYLAKKLQQGKTRRAALRCLKTHLARNVFRFMLDNINSHPERWIAS